MGKFAILKKNPDLDFYVGFIGGPEIPTKQDKFKPLSDFEIIIDENGEKKKLEDHKLYLKKDGTDSLKDFEVKFTEILKENVTKEHPYKKDIPLEVIISVSMGERRLKEVDIDNLTKTIIDCMKGLIFEDDHQIIKILASKDVNSFLPLNGLMVGIRKLDKKESWFNGVKLAYFEYKDK